MPDPSQGFSRLATRLNSFRGDSPSRRSPVEALRSIAGVPGINAAELNYPQHFAGPADDALLIEARNLGLTVTALNLRFDSPLFSRGAFTHPETGVRKQAVATAIEAVEIAAGNDIGHVILWLGPDGFDYPFQADYQQLWTWAVEGLRAVAEHDSGVSVSIEYKPVDPRRYSLIRTMSDALLAARDTGAANVGVTLDFCHALMCGESPAMAASLALREGRLFGIHLNDGYGQADDGLMGGSVHPWQTLELLHVLKRGGWQGTLYFDTFPDSDPAAECAGNVAAVRSLEALIERIDLDELGRTQQEQDGVAASRLVAGLIGQ